MPLVSQHHQEHMGLVTIEEYNAVAHLRAWCHDSKDCPICKGEQKAMVFWKAKGRAEAITEIAEGEPVSYRVPYGYK